MGYGRPYDAVFALYFGTIALERISKDKIKKNEADPVECWGTGFPCAFNCVKSGINHEMEHVIPSSQQATIGSLCQRDNLFGPGQIERGENSIHNVLLHKIMEKMVF